MEQFNRQQQLQLTKQQWFLQPVPKCLNHCTVGMKIPMNVEVKADLTTPIEFKQQLQKLELHYNTLCENEQITLQQKTKLFQLQKKIASTKWFEVVDLNKLPIKKVRVYWAPQERCVVLKVRLGRFTNLTEQQHIELIDREILDQDLKQDLIRTIQQTTQKTETCLKQKKYITYKKVLQIPEFTCPKTLKVQLDRERHVLVVKSVINLDTDEQILNVHRDFLSQAAFLKRLVEQQSVCQRCTDFELQPCQPRNLVISLEDLFQHSRNDERLVSDNLLKYIINEQSPELFYASKKIRSVLQMVKQVSVHGMMKSPRFIRRLDTSDYLLRLQFVLPQFPLDTLKVKLIDERKRLVQIEARKEVRCVKTGQIMNVDQFCRQFVVPELIDIERMLHQYEEKTGLLTVTFPVNKDKSLYYYRELLNKC